MNKLPNWIFANKFPAVYDFESLTVIDQTARLYGTVNGLIEEFNKTVELLKTYAEQETESREEFELKITKVIMEFMCDWNEKIGDLNTIVVTAINEAIQSGKITVSVAYDPDTEALNIVAGGEM